MKMQNVVKLLIPILVYLIMGLTLYGYEKHLYRQCEVKKIEYIERENKKRTPEHKLYYTKNTVKIPHYSILCVEYFLISTVVLIILEGVIINSIVIKRVQDRKEG